MGCFQNVLSRDPCCGSIKLWTASVIIGGAEVIISVSAIIIYILALATVGMYNTVDAYRHSRISAFLKFWNLDRDDENIDDISSRLYQLFGVALFFCLANLCVASFLLFAVLKRQILLVRIWIAMRALGISLCVIYLLTTLILGQTTVLGVSLDLAEIVLLFYTLWIVYAFMRELVAEQVLKMSPSIIHSQGKIEVSFPL